MIRNIVVLTGAGISAESGIPIFRSETGLWENHRVEDVATPEGFEKDKNLVINFYNTLRNNLKKVEPNRAHYAIAKLQKNWSHGNVFLVTQNIDDLHERAGSQIVFHMHGELLKLRCDKNHDGCGHIVEINNDQIIEQECPKCHKKSILRPHIVWFGEVPLYMNEIEKSLDSVDLFISIGTSGVVYPAAGFVRAAKTMGAKAIEFNLNPSLTKSFFDGGIYGKAGETLPKFVDYLLSTGELPKF